MNFQIEVLMRAVKESCRLAGYDTIQVGLGNFGDMMLRAWPRQARTRANSRLKLILKELDVVVHDFGGYSCDQVTSYIFEPEWKLLQALKAKMGDEIVRL